MRAYAKVIEETSAIPDAVGCLLNTLVLEGAKALEDSFSDNVTFVFISHRVLYSFLLRLVPEHVHLLQRRFFHVAARVGKFFLDVAKTSGKLIDCPA